MTEASGIREDLAVPAKLDRTRAAETPNTIHGRLMESVHIAGYTFERACSEFEWLLEDNRWQALGFDDFNKFLATLNWSEFRISAERRKKIAKLCADADASKSATARMLGVNEGTIRGDLKSENSETDDAGSAGANDSKALDSESSEWFQRDAEPAELVKKQAKSDDKKRERETNNSAIKGGNRQIPKGKYAVIYADPPWTFKVWSGEGKDRAAENHYPTMTQEQIEALPIGDLAADDCALFMWAVWPQLPEALSVIEAWGFEYKTCGFLWTKQTKDEERFATGMGYWTRANSEPCLFATKGSPKRINADVHQVIASPRMEHSQKPDEVASRIERLVAGPYIELFARRPRDGWEVWGNQA